MLANINVGIKSINHTILFSGSSLSSLIGFKLAGDEGLDDVESLDDDEDLDDGEEDDNLLTGIIDFTIFVSSDMAKLTLDNSKQTNKHIQYI